MDPHHELGDVAGRPVVKGRPPKFLEKRRPVTVTLPERILGKLERISVDRAKAIVKCVESVMGADNRSVKPLELVKVLPGKALIIVGPCKTLSGIRWLSMVEISPSRFLLVLPSGMSMEAMELAILDLVENQDPADEAELAVLNELRVLLRHQRRKNAISKGELVFVAV